MEKDELKDFPHSDLLQQYVLQNEPSLSASERKKMWENIEKKTLLRTHRTASIWRWCAAASLLAFPDSQLHFVRRLLRLRKQYPALACRGEIEFFQKGNNAYPIVYERRKDNQHILVCINPSGKRVKTVRTCADGFKTISPILTKGKTQNIKSKKGHLYLDVPELSVGIYQVD